MRVTMLSAVLVGLVGSPAVAADLYVAPVDVVLASTAAHDWSGLYAGLDVGGKFGGGYIDQFNDFYYYDGILAGVHVGYNWQTGSSLVLGLEGDLALYNSWLSSTNFGAGFSARLNATGSIRARVGVAAGNALLYGTAGVIAANQTYAPGAATPATRTHLGWVAGVGMQYAVDDNWSVRAEYLRFDPGSQTYNVGLGDYQADMAAGNIVRAGVSYGF